MIIDIIQTIINYGNIYEQIRLAQVNRDIYDDIYIYKLDGRKMDNLYIKDINILKQKKFGRIKILVEPHFVPRIKNKENTGRYDMWSETLEELYCVGDGICCYDVITNQKQNNIADQKQSDIVNLKKLKILGCNNCSGITSVNHLANTLKVLSCCGNRGIDQDGISELKTLKNLYCCHNNGITDVNHLADTLQILDCSEKYCGINQNG